MTTFIPFEPQPGQPFQFSPEMDGQVHTAIVTWSLFGRRWMVNMYSIDGSLVFSLPMIGSPSGVNLQALSWKNGYVEAATILPHGYNILDTVAFTISGCAPDAYNGKVRALIVAPNRMQWPLAADPGGASKLGSASFDIDIAGGYFATSSLIFRETTNQFEVSP